MIVVPLPTSPQSHARLDRSGGHPAGRMTGLEAEASVGNNNEMTNTQGTLSER